MKNPSLILITACFFLVPETTSSFQKTNSIGFREIATLGEEKGSEFIEVGMIAVDEKGGIYVTEKMRHLVNQYTSSGRLKKRIEKNEKAKARFSVGPYQISVSNRNVAVVDFGLPVIKVFDLDLNYREEIRAPGPIMDVSFLSDNVLYIASITRDRNEILTRHVLGGESTMIPLKNAQGGSFYDMNYIEVDTKGRLIVAYSYRNKVEVFDNHANFILDLSVPGLPDSAGARSIKLHSGEELVPEGNVFRDVAVDPKGNIFLLGGDNARLPNQTLYVLDQSGKLVCTTQLPNRSGLIFIDRHGYLYTRENQRKNIRKYRMEYTGF